MCVVSAVTSYAVATGDRVADSFLDRIGTTSSQALTLSHSPVGGAEACLVLCVVCCVIVAHPIVSLFLEPLVLEPMEVLQRAIKRYTHTNH